MCIYYQVSDKFRQKKKKMLRYFLNFFNQTQKKLIILVEVDLQTHQSVRQ